jgi:Zn-dependent peptidase ImmA (M78 family)
MSHILSQIIKKKLPEWNERIFAYDNLQPLCRGSGVGLIEAPIRAKGEYTSHDGVPIIILKRGLAQKMRLWVGLHELGHHLLHYPSAHSFSKGIYSKVDREANFFAAIAMMPTELCRTATPAEIAAEYDYPPEIIQIRLEISENLRI